jgi:hypothetical protein
MKKQLATKEQWTRRSGNIVFSLCSLCLWGVFFLASARAEAIHLAWDPNPEGKVAGYHVYRSLTSGGPYTRITTAPSPSTYYVDDSAEAAQTYYYAVTAVDSAGTQSSFSREVGVTLAKFDLVPRGAALVARTIPNIAADGGQLVILSGNAHNPENKTLSFLWTQTLGPGVPITGKTKPEASIMAPNVATTLAFTLTVTDGDVTIATDTLQVLVQKR